ncbi:Hypothetical predicted protein [Paramuricea clavata]|uniref:Uncharacterized protein n=1 Tax=Paramuricea clavata TaxID=317549 RepID=A0A6S7FUR1_PARCT|nr:Hypothetical predicted protein [Paramuricea clavata]
MGSVHSEVFTVSDATTINTTSGVGGGAREDSIANSPSTQQHPVRAASPKEGGWPTSSSKFTSSKPVVTVRELAKVLGHLTSTIQDVFPAPLHFRHLQECKNKALGLSHTYEHPFKLTIQAKEELVWWRDNLDAWIGKALVTGRPDLVIETDASQMGWGAFCMGTSTGGQWSQAESSLHINCLELLAGASRLEARPAGVFHNKSVVRPTRELYSGTNSTAPLSRPLNTPDGDASITQSPTSRLAAISQSYTQAGISQPAQELLLVAWRKGTATTYASAWRKWDSWCCEREISSVHAPIEAIIEF